ncbi:MAG: beta-glucosidase BglX [Lachnospiraceae bacterium]|nr:beta-glucosidase BglX [Lachnospiraceae bacterium]
MTQEKLLELLGDMSLQEKVDQLLQLHEFFYTGNQEEVATGPAREMGITEEDITQAGSILGSYGAKKLKKLQDDYMAKQPHHIPMLFMMDVIHGMKTIFPAPIAQGAAFDPKIGKMAADIAAREAAVTGLHVTFSPMVDLVRDARWGRVVESTGEDPYLNAEYAKAIVEGFQGENNDLTEKFKIASCIKHFAGYGGAEAGRDYNTVEMSRPAFREYYLKSYKAGIDAGAALVMTSFNTVEGVPASVNKWLMRDILRKDFGFDGVLISDYAAIEESIYHGVSEDKRDAAKKGIEAGVDIDMMTGCYAANLAKLVEDGEVDEKLVDEAVLRVLELKNKLGLFENPYKDADEKLEKEMILSMPHRIAAREAAARTFVLLKNETDDGGFKYLPLKEGKKTAFVGPFVESQSIMSAWAVTGDEDSCVSVAQALRETFGSKYLYAKGCEILGDDVKIPGFRGMVHYPSTPEETEKLYVEAENVAKDAEQVVLFLGEDTTETGEAASKGFIELPEVQQELLRRVHKVNDNIIVVLFTGRPLDLREVSELSKSILVVWRPGTEGGHAIVDVLTGKRGPCGKLPMSFPYCVGQVPVHYDSLVTGRPAEPGTTEKFKSRYLDIPNEPLYPFGFGLTYTTIAMSDVKLDKSEMTADGKITATVTVKNLGDVVGVETPQLYIHDVKASIARPAKQLKGFEKVELMPGNAFDVKFEITKDMLTFVDGEGNEVLEKGEFEVFVGFDSATTNKASFVLK